MYAFRGRILIGSDADDILNLDVTKSRIHLSEIAEQQLTPIISEAKKKSRNAWRWATAELHRRTNMDPHSEINAELDRLSDLEEEGEKLEDQAAPAAEREERKKKRETLQERAGMKSEESELLRRQGRRVQYVEQLENNQLWEMAHDPDEGLIVRVNMSHRLYRDIISVQAENSDLIRVLDIFFFALARGEWETLYKGGLDIDYTARVLEEYRVRTGGELGEILRQLVRA